MTAPAPLNRHAADLRRHPRLTWPMPGRFALDDRLEHRCRTIDVSPGGLALEAPTRGEVGDRVVCYLDDLGRLEGRIVRLFEAGFALEIQATPTKREKLAQQIAWQARRPPAPVREQAEARMTPDSARSVLLLPDGRRARVQVVDLTAGGAALICPLPLAIGQAVQLDGRPAHVARVAQALIGLDFAAA